MDEDEYRKRLETDFNLETRATARMLGFVLLLLAICTTITTCVAIVYWAPIR